MLPSGRTPLGHVAFAPVHLAPLGSYIPMPRGHCYLVAIMDWHSRAVLSWEVSNSMDTGFCLRALQSAFERTGRKPKVFNNDLGSQFTGPEWVKTIEENGI